MKNGILFIPHLVGHGGTETVIHNLFTALQDNTQLNLTVYSIGGTDDASWTSGVKFKSNFISRYRPFRTLYYMTILPFKIKQIIREEHPDVVISTNPVMWYLAKKAITSLKLRVPVFSWYHYSLKQKPISKVFLRSADYYLAISSGIKRQLMQQGIKEEQISLIFNPIISDHHPISRSSSVPHFIYLGRVDLDGQKNVRELMDSLSLLTGEWVLDIYGDTSDASSVIDYAKYLKISDRIHWMGFVKDPWKNIKCASALILTSKYEGLPMVLCEAISHGVPCISANVETGPEDIINSSNGWLYTPGQPKELSTILQKIIDNPDVLPATNTIISSSSKFSISNYRHQFLSAVVPCQ
ncbi:glycosyltransferase [Limosilactobacillus fermentum]